MLNLVYGTLQTLLGKIATKEAPLIFFDGEGYGSTRCSYCSVGWEPGDDEELQKLVEFEPKAHDADCGWRLAHELLDDLRL